MITARKIFENRLVFTCVLPDGSTRVQGKRQPKGGATKEQVAAYRAGGLIRLVKHIMSTQGLRIIDATRKAREIKGEDKRYG